MSEKKENAENAENTAPVNTTPEKTSLERNEVIDRLSVIVKSQGPIDDIIDGVYMGVLAISLLVCIFFALLGTSVPNIFPVLAPVYDLVYKIPGLIMGMPQIVMNFPSKMVYVVTNMSEIIVEAKGFLLTFPGILEEFLSQLEYKKIILTFSWAAYLWEAYLDVRQRDMLHKINRPKAIKSFVSLQSFLEANAYGLDKSSLKIVQSLYEQIKTTIVFQFDILPWIWQATGKIMESIFGYGPEYEITQSVLFFVSTSVMSSLTNIPFDLYGTFVIEEKHGFNKQSIGLYFGDFFKTLALTGVFGSLVLSGLLWVIKMTGTRFYLYVMVFMMAVQFIGITIYPTFIQPLFNKFTPLEEGELRTAIEELATRVDFPLKKLYVVDGSKRSGHSNAYMYGFFKNKRIVLFDTLIKQTNLEEVCAILAHELGHWKMSHVVKMLIFGQLQLFVIFYLFSLVVAQRKMYSDFNFTTSQPILIGFTLYQYLYQPVDSLVTFIFNKLSRKHEFEADAYSKSLGYAKPLRDGLIKLHLENKGNVNPDPLYSAYHYSHPPLVERLNAIEQ